jgi:ribonuclease BN (tRNA processing enzyme)
MELRVTILGSGTCVPRLDRSACAVLVETGQVKILMDLGPGTMGRLLAAGTTIFDLTHIFLSHFHPDHTAELAPLLFSTKYPDAARRTHALTVLGGRGMIDFYKGLQAAYGDWIVLPEHQLRFQELDTTDGETVHMNDVTLSVRPVQHRPESLACRVDSPGGVSMVYSGDTDMCDSLGSLARRTDLFVCESALPDDQKVPGHLTPSLAGRLARRAEAKRLVLTHLYPPSEDADIVKQARSTYKGEIAVAEDLMSFEFDIAAVCKSTPGKIDERRG